MPGKFFGGLLAVAAGVIIARWFEQVERSGQAHGFLRINYEALVLARVADRALRRSAKRLSFELKR